MNSFGSYEKSNKLQIKVFIKTHRTDVQQEDMIKI